ncbi:GPP34 family phosphoprotein [Streptomyces sp. NPDC059009]|uniref:GOLPH3/VPS74 family protein n=1 Tax=Streptomyces sp. NPDC059009 TaxID=3346694 RepID=UPI0036CBFB2F
MTTAQDLAIVAAELTPDRPVEQGELSLALAGAEVLDLVEAKALVVDGDRIVPHAQEPTGDRLLNEAAAALVRQEPHESVEDWLWRRGRGLSTAYADDLVRTGPTARQPSRWARLRSRRTEPVDATTSTASTASTASAPSTARSRAEGRWSAGEPVLAALASAAGLRAEPVEDTEELTGDPVATVLAAVGGAVQELQAVRQRKAIEDAAFDNVWRGY